MVNVWRTLTYGKNKSRAEWSFWASRKRFWARGRFPALHFHSTHLLQSLMRCGVTTRIYFHLYHSHKTEWRTGQDLQILAQYLAYIKHSMTVNCMTKKFKFAPKLQNQNKSRKEKKNLSIFELFQKYKRCFRFINTARESIYTSSHLRGNFL